MGLDISGQYNGNIHINSALIFQLKGQGFIFEFLVVGYPLTLHGAWRITKK